jgi:hypothetical protein
VLAYEKPFWKSDFDTSRLVPVSVLFLDHDQGVVVTGAQQAAAKRLCFFSARAFMFAS